ncbi:MAG: 50S ribosomal protein L11 methyltransferase [Desulfobacteraceae bacterium]
MKTITGNCPYNILFIYHIDGIFSSEYEKNLGRNYIGNWVEDKYSFLFFSEDPGNNIEEIISQQPDLHILDKYSFSYEEWQGGGFEKKHIEDFIIVPPWEEVSTDSALYKIILDPGVVFGNGLHPTTKNCIRAVSYLKRQYSYKTVLDIGTGTGILAIASVYLGAKEVTAIDLNPLAVKTAVNNVLLNNFNKQIKVFEGKAEDYACKEVDLLIANIHFDVIKIMFANKGFLDKNYCIFSGLMRSQAGDLKDLIKNTGMNIVKEWDHEMTWYTILAGRTHGK